jgi:hypothetical protein
MRNVGPITNLQTWIPIGSTVILALIELLVETLKIFKKTFFKGHIRASPALLSIWSCTVQLDEEKSKYAGLAQENIFGSASFHHQFGVAGESHTAMLSTCRKESNK